GGGGGRRLGGPRGGGGDQGDRGPAEASLGGGQESQLAGRLFLRCQLAPERGADDRPQQLELAVEARIQRVEPGPAAPLDADRLDAHRLAEAGGPPAWGVAHRAPGAGRLGEQELILW